MCPEEKPEGKARGILSGEWKNVKWKQRYNTVEGRKEKKKAEPLMNVSN